MIGMMVTINYHQDTGLIELICPSGSMLLTQTEAAMVYTILGRALGFRGRFKLWLMRRKVFRGTSVDTTQ